MNAFKELVSLVESKNYTIEHTKFSELINGVLNSGSDDDLEGVLTTYLQNAPRAFYSSHLSVLTLSVFEKYLNKSIAVEIAIKILKDPQGKANYALAVLLRICRINKDYTAADELFLSNPVLKKITTFDVLYEIVFYYEYKQMFNEVENVISVMIGSYSTNTAVIKTATSLSIRFGLYDRFQKKLDSTQKKTIATKPEKDIIERIEESEYQRMIRSAALSDLANGIAHEFGQPVTNIRYGVQYHRKIFEDASDNKIDKKLVLDFFEEVLLQTERIGQLTKKLSPVTNSKAAPILQDLEQVFKNLQNQEHTKLLSLGIKFDFKIYGTQPIRVIFDPTQLNQVFSNLLNNAVDGILEKKSKDPEIEGNIFATAKTFGTRASIWFQDNGTGIDVNNVDRVFNPFFTTKAPDKGQGLGLYIVSNLLKMNGGQITIDRKYKKGAKFIITI